MQVVYQQLPTARFNIPQDNQSQDLAKSRSFLICIIFPNRFENWQASRQHSFRVACQIAKRYEQFNI